MLEITASPKSLSDVTLLLQEVNVSPFIGQLTTSEIEQHIRENTIRFFYQDSAIVGFGAWDNITTEWCEIGPFYSLFNYRGQGLGTQLVETLLTLNAGKKLFAATKNPIVKKMLVKFGFQPVRFYALPGPIYVHLLARISPQRLLNLARKLRLSSDPMSQYIKLPG